MVSGELRIVALDLKMQLGDIKLAISNLRNEMKELVDEVRKGNSPIVVGNAAVFVVFLAMLCHLHLYMYSNSFQACLKLYSKYKMFLKVNLYII